MKRTLILLLLLFMLQSLFAQSLLKRYKDSIFTASEMITVDYGSNTNYLGEKETLKADIYTPLNDTANNRSIIIYVHGGGFRSGHRNDAAIPPVCETLSKKGFVVASIDYRVGFERGNLKNLLPAVLRAIQDLNAFVRYTKANAKKLGIDTSKIFICGSSAGGVTALAKAYMKFDSLSARFGVFNNADLEGTTNDLPNTSSVAGVYSMWGAIFDTSWIQKGDIPVGCIQSIGDTTIPWNSGYFTRNKAFPLYGSNAIYTRARNQGIFTTVHGYHSADHDLGIKVSPYRDTTIQLMCDFFYQLINSSPKNKSSKKKDKRSAFSKHKKNARRIEEIKIQDASSRKPN